MNKENVTLDPLSERIRSSRSAEIARIAESLRSNENVYVTGKFVTGKTKLAQEMVKLAKEGKVWEGKIAKGFYTHIDHMLDKDEMNMEQLAKIESGPAVIVLDELSKIAGNNSSIEDFISLVREFNEKGIRVIAVSGTNPKLYESIKSLFPTVIDFQSPPENMSKSDLEVFEEANSVYGE